jgi:hypothetical protein
MGVADENPFGSGMRLMRIEPKTQFRQMHGAALELDSQVGHETNVNADESVVKEPQSKKMVERNAGSSSRASVLRFRLLDFVWIFGVAQAYASPWQRKA